MKGVIFNLLERAVVDEHGEDAWDDLLDEADSDGVYTALGQYDDTELLRIVAAVGELRVADRATVLRWFGRRTMPVLAERYPGFFRQASDLTAFLLSLNNVIHSEVRKLYPGAVVPHFDFALVEPGVLEMTYRSPRSMCHLAIGFAEGAAEHFGEAVEVLQPTCLLEEQEECLIRVRHVP